MDAHEASVWQQLDPAAPDFEARWQALMAGGNGRGAMDRLRRSHGPEFARFVSLQVELGKRVQARFPGGRLSFFTAKGFEQATAARVADERARQIRARLGDDASATAIIWDACCGVGSDALALAAAGFAVLATDRDPEVLGCAAANGVLWRRGEGDGPSKGRINWARAEAQHPPLVAAAQSQAVALLDPDRRDANGRRITHPEHWSPPLGEILGLAARFRGSCIKLPPGFDSGQLDPACLPQTQSTWVSLDGEMKELMLWTGALARGETREAVRLAGSGARRLGAADPVPVRESFTGSAQELVGQRLVEVDVAAWQAGLEGLASPAAALDGSLRGGFLVAPERGGDAPCATGFTRSWRILGATSLDRRRVRAMLREHGRGPLTVKTRGVRASAEALGRKLKGPGERPGLLAVCPGSSGTLALLLEEPEWGARGS